MTAMVVTTTTTYSIIAKNSNPSTIGVLLFGHRSSFFKAMAGEQAWRKGERRQGNDGPIDL